MLIYDSLIVWMSSILISDTAQPEYNVLMKEHSFELREYTPLIVAETVVDSTFESAGNDAFHILAGYIFGKNDQGVKIEMTAPVTEFEVAEGKFAVQFIMPSDWTLATLPKPLDSRVTIKELPARKVFSKRYHSGWSEREYQNELSELKAEAKKLGVNVRESEPIWARYNSPMSVPAFRTNEIWVEVA